MGFSRMNLDIGYMRCKYAPCSIYGDAAMNRSIKAVIHRAEEGGYWAEVPSLPGCATQGETEEEIAANLREAIEGCQDAKAGLQRHFMTLAGIKESDI